jgi:hypothetical protein
VPDGEAARGTLPRSVRADARLLADFQDELVVAGVELAWPAEARAY